jgi:hypothetical protein
MENTMNTFLRSSLFILFFLLVLVSKGTSEVIYNIKFSPPSPASLALNEDLSITFNYTCTHTGGIMIFARPYTNGALTPLYAASGSPIYPVGSATGNGTFKITSGNVIVDHIRFQVYNSDQSQLLLEFFVPVEYHFSTNAIKNIVLTPTTPSPIQLNTNLSLTFNYTTAQTGGVLIFARPFTHGALSPGYGASGSPLYATGSGSGSGTFTFTSGSVTVDSIRFQMYNSNQTQLLLEFFVPVDYHFGAHAIANVQLSPASPASLPLNQNLNISFNYTTNQAGGVLIFARPFTHGALSPGYGASGSPLYTTGTGSGSGTFSFSSGSVAVDSIRFQIYNSTQTTLLSEYFVPVKYYFGPHSITNIQFTPSSPAYFTFNVNDSSSFNYSTTEPTGALIFPRPFTKGALTPAYSASGSPFYTTGSGNGSGYFAITAGNVLVDQMRFQMLNANQSQTLLEFFVPVKFYYGNVALTEVEASSSGLPEEYTLYQNYPNPFNPSTKIDYQVPSRGYIEIIVYNLLGKKVATLVNQVEEPGNKSVYFNAGNLPSGVYFYRIQAGSFVETKKMMLVK